MKKIIILSFLFCSIISKSQQIDIEKIDAIIDSKVSENDPGLFVGIVKNGKIVYEKYRGLSNLEHQVKVDKHTKCNIASVAKQFTALMILQLSLEQRLDLEDDIRKYLPNMYPKVIEEIRIRHLLNHTSGIRDYSDLMSIQQNPWWKRIGDDNNDIMTLLENQEDLAFEPGSRKMYSNSGYIVLTKIIAEVTGESFYDYSKKFFEELGMDNTVFSKNYMLVIPNKAIPYSDWGDGIWKAYPMLTNFNGDGFLYTTLKDQLVFEQSIQNAQYNNNVLLIESQKAIPKSEITKYGFGLELEDRLNYKAVHHSGGTGSYHAQVVRYFDENLSIFVMSNNSRIWSGFIADDIANAILPVKEPNYSYDESIKNIQNQTQLESLVGQYVSPRGNIIRIQSDNDKLYWKMDNNNPIELKPEKENLYSMVRYSSTKIKFNTIEDKLTAYYPDSDKRTYRKIDNFVPSQSYLESIVGEYYSSELDIGFTIELNTQGQLMIHLQGRKDSKQLELINRDHLLYSDYRMKVFRDVFNRISGISLTTNRVLNNKFHKKTNLQFQPKIPTENGSINVTTIGSRDGQSSQILLTKNYANGNEIWSNQFGGESYDKASSIMSTADGYIIVGSTSSFGKGNYDMFVIKTDKKGDKIWQKTYGDFYNEYGYAVEKTDNGYLIKGTIQNCSSNSDVFNRNCETNVWFVAIDENGDEISDQVLEEIE